MSQASNIHFCMIYKFSCVCEGAGLGFPGGPVIKTLHFNVGGASLIPVL